MTISAPLFITMARQQLVAARSGALAGDCDGVRQALHALKSGAGRIGATTLYHLCSKGEALAAQDVAGPLLALVDTAYCEYLAAVRMLKSAGHDLVAPATRESLA